MSQLRSYLPHLLVFLLVFAATVFFAAPGLLETGWGPTRPEISGPGDGEVRPFGRRPEEQRPADAGPSAAVTPTSDGAADAAPGTLRVLLKDDDGAPVFGASVSIHPADGGHHRDLADGGFEIAQLAPGSYRLQIWSDRHVPKTVPALRVRPGAVDVLDVVLERGVIPRGSVHDEKDKRPIPDAIVTLGTATFRSGPDGTFAGAFPLPRSVLEGVRVEHPDYDVTTYVKVPGLDLENLRLPMTRGDSSLVISVTNSSGRWAPPHLRVQVLRELGGDDRLLKRDVLMAASERHEIRGLHAGHYTVVLSFPETELSARSSVVQLLHGDRREIPVVLDAGADVDGRVVQARGRVAQRELTLLDERQVVLGVAHSNADGRFAFRNVPAGRYSLRTSHGGPRWNTETFEVPDSGVVRVTVDFDTQRLAVGTPPPR